MAVTGEYEPSPEKWVRDQVEAYESSDLTRAYQPTGRPSGPTPK
jgi:hypothetical protein